MKKCFIIFTLCLFLLSGTVGYCTSNQSISNNTTDYTYNKDVDDASNTYLKELSISEEGLTPFFTKYITDYEIFVGENINGIKIEGIPEYSGATVTTSGNTNLKNGNNLIEVKVVSASKEKERIYKIIVTKGKNQTLMDSYLVELVVDGFPLTPKFTPQNYIYNIGKIGQDVNKLDVIPIPRNQAASFKVLGATELKDGANQIKVLVTSEDRSTTKEYIINYDRTPNQTEEKSIVSEGGESAISQEIDVSKIGNMSNLTKWIIFAIVLIILTVVGFVIRKYTLKKSKYKKS